VLGALVALAAVSVVLVAVKVGRPLRGGETSIAAASGGPSSAGPVQRAGNPPKVKAKVTASDTGSDAADDPAAGTHESGAPDVDVAMAAEPEAARETTEDAEDAPAEEALVEPVEVARAEPLEETPAGPAEETPAGPAEETPAEPVEVVRAEPVEETPAEPAERKPAEPVEVARAEPVEEAASEPEEVASEPVEEEAPAAPVRVLTRAEDEANKAAIRGLKVMAVFGDERGIGVYTSGGELRRGGRFQGMDITQVTLKYVVFECGNKRYKWMLGR
jgi:hypothetical protein